MYQKQVYSLLPRYEDNHCRRIGVLQHLQTLLHKDATLDDVAQLIQDFQQEFGFHEQLESVIQSLVARSLTDQIAYRENGCKQSRTCFHRSTC